MTERRPHWDDDLIEAVHEAIAAAVDDYTTVIHLADEDICAIIAAVEDWFVASDQISVVDVFFAKARAEQAEATIRRVREATEIRPISLHHDYFHAGYATAMSDILRALDGGAE